MDNRKTMSFHQPQQMSSHPYLSNTTTNPYARRMVNDSGGYMINPATMSGSHVSSYATDRAMSYQQQFQLPIDMPTSGMAGRRMPSNRMQQQPTVIKYSSQNIEAPLDLSSGKRTVLDGPIDLTVKKQQPEDDDIIIVSEEKPRTQYLSQHYSRNGMSPNYSCRQPSLSDVRQSRYHMNPVRHSSPQQSVHQSPMQHMVPFHVQKAQEQGARNVCAVRPQLLTNKMQYTNTGSMQQMAARHMNRQEMLRPPQQAHHSPSSSFVHNRPQYFGSRYPMNDRLSESRGSVGSPGKHAHSPYLQLRNNVGNSGKLSPFPLKQMSPSITNTHRSVNTMERLPMSDNRIYTQGVHRPGHSEVYQRELYRQQMQSTTPKLAHDSPHHPLSDQIRAERQIVERFSASQGTAPQFSPKPPVVQKPEFVLKGDVGVDSRMMSAKSCEIFKREMALAQKLSDHPTATPIQKILSAPGLVRTGQPKTETKSVICPTSTSQNITKPTASIATSRAVPVANVNPIIAHRTNLPLKPMVYPPVSNSQLKPKWWTEHTPSTLADKSQPKPSVIDPVDKTPSPTEPNNRQIHVVRSRGTFDVPVTPQSFPFVRDPMLYRQQLAGVQAHQQHSQHQQQCHVDRQNISDRTRDFSLQFLKTFGNKDSELVRKLEAEAQNSQKSAASSAVLHVVKNEPVEIVEDEVIEIKSEVVSDINESVTKTDSHIKIERPHDLPMPINKIGRPTALPLKLARKRHYPFANMNKGFPKFDGPSTHLDGFKEMLSCPLKAMKEHFKSEPETTSVILSKAEIPEVEVKPQTETPVAEILEKEQIKRLPAKLERKSGRFPHALPRSPTKTKFPTNTFAQLKPGFKPGLKHGLKPGLKPELKPELKPRKYRRLLNEIANSDGFICDYKRKRTATSVAVATSSGQEGGSILANEVRPYADGDASIDTDEDDANKRFVDFHPEILPARTRMQAASQKTGPPLPTYNKYAAYEVELEKEEARKQLRKQLKKRERHHERKRLEGSKVVGDARHQELLEKIMEKQRLKTARETFMPHSIHFRKKMKRLRKRKFDALQAYTESVKQWEIKKKKDIPVILYKSCGETMLHRLARQGNLDMARECLESGEHDVNARDNAGFCPLHECCVKGFTDIAELLLNYGAEVNSSSMDGIRPIHDAVENNYLTLTRLLVQYGADLTLATYSGKAPLAIASTAEMFAFISGCLADTNGANREEDVCSWSLPGPFETDPSDLLDDVPSDDEYAAHDIVFEMKKGLQSESYLSRVVPYFT